MAMEKGVQMNQGFHKEYETVIGLEVHVELATATKIFCGCSTAFGGRPNSHTCPVCTGMPGSLPVLNRKVLEHAVAVGLATNCQITRYCKFDRKNYFYPDNPQNYQISQLYLPICREGYVEIEVDAEEPAGSSGTSAEERSEAVEDRRTSAEERSEAVEDRRASAEERSEAVEDGRTSAEERSEAAEDRRASAEERSEAVEDRRASAEERGEAAEDRESSTEEMQAAGEAEASKRSGLSNADRQKKRIGIHEIHMEEDAGKLIHDDWEDCTLVDYNRSGVPLIEIVSEPDMRNAQEVIAYLEKLRLIIQYLGASDCKLQEGSMRADVNLSVREAGSQKLGTRTEMKNLNSFHAIARAIEGERNRQIDLLESGQAVVQETRRWDDAKGVSYAMRSKEDAQDYRYFPDPDLPPVCIDDGFLAEIRSRQPEFRTEKQARYKAEYDIPDYDIEIITGSKHMADLFEATVALGSQPKKVSNWLMVETLRLLKERELDPEDIRFSPRNLAKLIALAEGREINSTVAKEIFELMFDNDIDPERYVEEHGLKMVNDTDALRRTVEEVIAANPKSVQDYRNGKDRAIGFLVGQTMKAMKGKANPVSVDKLLRELL